MWKGSDSRNCAWKSCDSRHSAQKHCDGRYPVKMRFNSGQCVEHLGTRSNVGQHMQKVCDCTHHVLGCCDI